MANPLLVKYINRSVYDLFNDPDFIKELLRAGYINEFFVPETKKLSVNMVIRKNIHLSTKKFIKLKEVQKLIFYAGWRINNV